ncbi:hypothetical protein SCL_1589 [Sulfuricaulis limicola]|uniref:IPT/TIG domain-containing protein n=1 Tax=Sulfuricaulis limicola TaxID=1620215 RepID=A0A1B4XGF3_9GAMM|nr:IPT/TIG domain-containing protein [Sulfuricaulis limicola]BAV33894.1 hypothetical protein SCL_1589 [Sulfuricaulis limicola]
MHNNAKDNKLLSAWSRLIIVLLLLCLGALRPAGAATYLGTATVYQGGDPARVIDVVYVPIGFTDSWLYPAFTEGTVPYTSQFLTSYAPFTSYQSFFNIHRLDAYSTVNEEAALRTLASQYLPDVDVIIFVYRDATALVNRCGGEPNVLACANMGGDVHIHYGTYMDVLAHELGHAIGYLADEYVSTTNCPSGVYEGLEPTSINATINTDRTALKWRDWLGIDGVDLFPGALYCSTGAYRPRATCRMGAYDGGSPQQPFDPVCREGLIREINSRVYPFVSLTPSNQFQFNLSPQPKTFSVVPDLNIRPQGAAYQYEWYLNYQLIPGATSTSYTLDLSTLAPGQTHTLRIVPVDPDINDFVRIANLEKPAAIETGWFISVVATAPTISSFTPTSGGAGVPVTISGSNFTGATAVKFNGTLSTYQVVSAMQINATVPASATTGPITVTTPNGTATSAQTFTVYSPPTITYYSPLSALPGALVNVYGNNFCGIPCNPADTQLKLNGVSITPTSVSATNIQFTLPAGSTSGYLTVTTPFGAGSVYFIVQGVPQIIYFGPFIATTGTIVTIQGFNFCGIPCFASQTQARLNGLLLPITEIFPGYLKVQIPAGAASGYLTVTTPAGMATSSSQLIIQQPPTISSFTPTSGPVGTLVDMSGFPFCAFPCDASQIRVSLNGAPVTLRAALPGYLRLEIPPGATSGKFTVTTAVGSVTSTGTFTVTP